MCFGQFCFFHSSQFAISNRKYFLRWRRTICVLSKLQPLNSVKGVRTYKSQNQTMCGRMLPCHVVPGALGCPTFLQHPSFSTASTRSWSACTRTCDTVGSLLTTNTPPRAFLDVILCEDTYKIIRKYKLRCSKKTKCCTDNEYSVKFKLTMTLWPVQKQTQYAYQETSRTRLTNI